MVLQPSPKEKYSIFFFHELPLYIKKDIFSDGIVITSADSAVRFKSTRPSPAGLIIPLLNAYSVGTILLPLAEILTYCIQGDTRLDG